MLQAVEAPLLKMAAVAGAGLLVAAFAGQTRCHHHDGVVQRLSLVAPEEPNALYLTAWSNGDIYVTLHDGKMKSMEFQTRAFINDGCEWLATETLVPDGANRYAYSYDETILSCEPGSTPARKTPRTGYAFVIAE
ncbi:MAG TPA: hypothetical protein VMZ53_02735 [Kofleriaceae bacterium]|nr:hypothetical protein [Kofleriaceae bacterium]